MVKHCSFAVCWSDLQNADCDQNKGILFIPFKAKKDTKKSRHWVRAYKHKRIYRGKSNCFLTKQICHKMWSDLCQTCTNCQTQKSHDLECYSFLPHGYYKVWLTKDIYSTLHSAWITEPVPAKNKSTNAVFILLDMSATILDIQHCVSPLNLLKWNFSKMQVLQELCLSEHKLH